MGLWENLFSRTKTKGGSRPSPAPAPPARTFRGGSEGLGLPRPSKLRSWVPFTVDFDFRHIRWRLKRGDQFKAHYNTSLAKMHYQEALAELEQLTPKPDTGDRAETYRVLKRYACWKLAEVLLGEGDWDAAQKMLEAGRGLLEPQNLQESLWLGERYLELGHGLAAQGHAAAALAAYLTAEKYKPSLDGKAHLTIAQTWAGPGYQRTDAAAIRKYLHYIPPPAWTSEPYHQLLQEGCRITLHQPLEESDLQERLRFNQRILEFHPLLSWPYVNLANGFFLLGKHDLARQNFEVLRVRKGPGDPSLEAFYSFWIGKTSYLHGDYPRAERELASLALPLLDQDLQAERELYLGLSLARLLLEPQEPGRIPTSQEIQQHLGRALELGCQHAEAFYYLGRLRLLEKQPQEAVSFLEAAVRLERQHPKFLYHLALALLEADPQGRRGEAKTLLKKARVYVPPEEPELEAEILMTLSELYEEEDKAREAETWFKRALQLHPRNPRVLLRSSWQHLREGDFAAAAHLAGEIVTEDIRIQRERSFILGRSTLRLSDAWEEAETWLRKAIHLGFAGWEPLYWLGMALAWQGRLEEARAVLHQALGQKHRPRERILVELGKLSLRQGQPEAALRYFRAAWRLLCHKGTAFENTPVAEEILFGLGRSQCMAGRLKNARMYFQELLALRSSHPGALFFLGVIAEKQGDLPEAEKHYRSLVEPLPPEPGLFQLEALVRRAILLFRSQRWEEAEELLQKALSIREDHEEARFFLGLVKLHRGLFAAAFQEWQQLGKLSGPEMADNLKHLHYLWGVALFQEGHHEEALRHFEEAQAPDLEHWRAEISYQQGRQKLEAGEFSEAIPLLARAAALKPEVWPYFLAWNFARLHAGGQHLEEAEEELAAKLREHPDRPELQYLLALAEFRLQKELQACERFEALCQHPAADRFITEWATFFVSLLKVRQGDAGALDLLLEMLNREAIWRHFPLELESFNALLAARLLQAYGDQALSRAELVAEEPFSYCLALLHSLLGKPETALKYFQQAMDRYPRKTRVAEHFALVLGHLAAKKLKVNQVPEALAYLSQAQKILS